MNDLRVKDAFALDPFEDMFRGMLRPWRGDPAGGPPQIHVDVHEDDEADTIKAEIPGVKREDIDVRIDGNVVTLGAEVRRDHAENKHGRVLRSERQYGYASRSFSLASAVDEAKADAKYTDGVLQLRLPKRANAGSRRVTVG
jgi:HSP20 family protein